MTSELPSVLPELEFCSSLWRLAQPSVLTTPKRVSVRTSRDVTLFSATAETKPCTKYGCGRQKVVDCILTASDRFRSLLVCYLFASCRARFCFMLMSFMFASRLACSCLAWACSCYLPQHSGFRFKFNIRMLNMLEFYYIMFIMCTVWDSGKECMNVEHVGIRL